jgi:hypothetical protein
LCTKCCIDGEGTLTQASVQYVGQWKDGSKNGAGKLTWSNGDVFVGNFKDDVMHGEGTLTCGNGDKYTGGWENNMVFDITLDL